ncbi:MAG: DegT/DnrJ/EryC1/StrS family aminotransferase [Candidatus Omnitrophota bacterium]
MNKRNNFRIPWSGRSLACTDEELDFILDVIKNADPLTQGKYLKQFEAEFAKYNSTPNSFAVSNCTNALDLAAILSGVKKGDEVIIPAHTFCAAAIPFARTGAKIVWADIDRDTRVVSCQSIEKLITPETRLIVAVHLYGLMADMESIMSLAKRNNCMVVEDCAQAIGAELKGEKSGSFADFGAFSFHCQKNITTLGEGGMLVVKAPDLAKKVPGLRHNGVREYSHKRDNYWQPAMVDVDCDIESVWPYNFCLSEPQCAMGIKLLKNLDKSNKIRIKRAEKFKKELGEFNELSFQRVPLGYKHVYHLLSAKYCGKEFKKTNHDFIELLAYKYKIKAIVQYYPLYRYPLFKKMGLGVANCPNTDDFFDNMVSFPFHVWMGERDFDYMIDSTKKALVELRG